MNMERMLTNILTDDLNSTRDTLTKLLDFKIEFEADWFISMTKGIFSVSAFKRDSEFVPNEFQLPAQGVILTFVVNDLSTYFTRAKNLGINIIEEPRVMPYGQRRMLIKDSSGVVFDISSPTAQLSDEYKSE
jgi:predicted enzyme related to lactoylglutathione lyase